MIFAAPRILTGPDSVTNVTGDKVVLMCEATGFPIPHIGWLFQRTDDETNSLPGILPYQLDKAMDDQNQNVVMSIDFCDFRHTSSISYL